MSIYSRNSVHTVSQWNIFDSRTNLYPDNRWSCNHCNGRFPSKGSTPGHIVQFQVLFSCRTSVDPDLFHYSKPSPRKQLQPPFARSNGRSRLKKRTASLRGLRSCTIMTGRRCAPVRCRMYSRWESDPVRRSEPPVSSPWSTKGQRWCLSVGQRAGTP